MRERRKNPFRMPRATPLLQPPRTYLNADKCHLSVSAQGLNGPPPLTRALINGRGLVRCINFADLKRTFVARYRNDIKINRGVLGSPRRPFFTCVCLRK